jgi:hypothetical protein
MVMRVFFGGEVGSVFVSGIPEDVGFSLAEDVDVRCHGFHYSLFPLKPIIVVLCSVNVLETYPESVGWFCGYWVTICDVWEGCVG